MRLHVLSDNLCHHPATTPEYALSMLIEPQPGEPWILWDAGASELTLRNARALGFDLSRVGTLAFSHGHWDHVDGLAGLLPHLPDDLRIYAHFGWCMDRWSLRDAEPRYIGVNPELRQHIVNRVTRMDESATIAPGVTILTNIMRWPGNMECVDHFSTTPERLSRDEVPDDSALLINLGDRDILVLGCTHAGVANTLQMAQSFSDRPLAAIVGGFHLKQATPDQIDDCIRILQRAGSPQIFPGHCTGDVATARLLEAFDGQQIGTGLCLEWDGERLVPAEQGDL